MSKPYVRILINCLLCIIYHMPTTPRCQYPSYVKKEQCMQQAGGGEIMDATKPLGICNILRITRLRIDIVFTAGVAISLY